MKVELINKPENTEKLVATAARLCYSNKTGSELLEGLTQEKIDLLNAKLIDSGHFSPFEHAHFTFSIENISRVCSHQLVRHRIANYSQKSQRYNQENKPNFTIPQSIKKKQNWERYFKTITNETFSVYKQMIEDGIPEEDARYILPQGIETNLIMTMNIRSLFNFFGLRLCKSAQWEIRELASIMLKLCEEEAPKIFEKASPCFDCNEVCKHD